MTPGLAQLSQKLSKRFWSKVDTSGTCWLWRGYKGCDGYGVIGVGFRTALAHRVSYLLSIGPIEDGKCVCHICDVPSCVRPSHLFVATQTENVLDCARKGRKPKGEANGNSKLTEQSVRDIRRAYATGSTSLGRLGKQYGVSGENIHAIVKRKTWVMLKQEV